MSWNVRIGINPLSWMNDDLPSLGGETALETALKEGKEIGYEGFELGNKFPKDGPGLKAKLDEFGLACVSDVSLARDNVSFRLPETSLGIVPAQIAPFVVRRLGPAAARRCLLTGERWDAAAAQRMQPLAEAVVDRGLAIQPLHHLASTPTQLQHDTEQHQRCQQDCRKGREIKRTLDKQRDGQHEDRQRKRQRQTQIQKP